MDAAAGLAQAHVQTGVAGDLGGFETGRQHAQLRQQRDGAGLGDALGGIQVLGLAGQLGLLVQQLAGRLGQALEATLQGGDGVDFVLDQQVQDALAGTQRMQTILGLRALRGQAIDLPAQVAQRQARRIGRRPHRWRQALAVLGQQIGIDAVGLAALKFELGEVMKAARVDHADRQLCVRQRHGQVQVVDPRGFEHHPLRACGTQAPLQLPMPFGGLRERLTADPSAALTQRQFHASRGHVDSGIDRHHCSILRSR